ncbi:MAG TPA: hypothetical protein VF918_01375 [Anaerolineales bacterium]
MRKKKDEVIYHITVSDIQEVAEDKLKRELTPEEVKLVTDRFVDYLPWYDAISLAIGELIPYDYNDDDDNELQMYT